MKLSPYSPRSIRFHELWKVGDLQLKGYMISAAGSRVSPSLWLAAREAVESSLQDEPTKLLTHGAGFVTVHASSIENQVNLDIWVNENELLHRVWVASSESARALSSPPKDHCSVCVWEVYVQSFERHSWIAYMLNNPDGPDLESYLTARLDADV